MKGETMKPSVGNMSGYKYTLQEHQQMIRWVRENDTSRSAVSSKANKYAKNQLARAERRHSKQLCKI